MAQYEKLEIMERTETGSWYAKDLRRKGMIPAVYYYHGEENLNLSLDLKKFWKALRSGHHIFEVNLKGEQQFVMIKELQYHPITDEIIHVDLMRVRRDEKITIAVPIVLLGTAEGTKLGGVLSQTLTAIEISCLPGDVPEQVTLDVTAVGLHESLSVADLEVADNIEIISAPESTVITVQVPKVVVEPEIPVEEEELEGEELEEGEAEAAVEGEGEGEGKGKGATEPAEGKEQKTAGSKEKSPDKS